MLGRGFKLIAEMFFTWWAFWAAALRRTAGTLYLNQIFWSACCVPAPTRGYRWECHNSYPHEAPIGKREGTHICWNHPGTIKNTLHMLSHLSHKADIRLIFNYLKFWLHTNKGMYVHQETALAALRKLLVSPFRHNLWPRCDHYSNF